MTDTLTLNMTRAQFLALAQDLGLSTTSYGGTLMTASDKHGAVMYWIAERPNGEPLPEPVARVPERYEAAARQILAP